MFHGKQSGRLITPIGVNDPAFKLAKTMGWPVAIGETGDDEYGLYALGYYSAYAWTNETVESSYGIVNKTVAKIPSPVNSKPVRVATANAATFAVMFENGETYAYNREGSYMLNSQTAVTNFKVPQKFNLYEWLDMSMSPYWVGNQPDSWASPVLLTSTAKHLGAPKSCSANIKSLEYNIAGDGFTGTDSNGKSFSYTLPSGATIKRMMIGLNISSVYERYAGLLYADDGIYVVINTYNNRAAFSTQKFDFPYAKIKGGWILSDCSVLAQGTNNRVYSGKCNKNATTPNITWQSVGMLDVKKIPETWGYPDQAFILTNDGKLYFWGTGTTPSSANSPSSPTQIVGEYLFDDVAVYLDHTVMAIGRKAA